MEHQVIGQDNFPTDGGSLRVALFSGNYNYHKDGAALTLNRLVAFLESKGVGVLVFSPTLDEPAFESSGTVISVPSVSLPRRKEYRLALGIPRGVKEKLIAFKPTLFHLSAPDALGYSALRLARRWGVPVVSSFHTRYDTYLQYYGMGKAMEDLGRAYLRHFYQQCEQVYAPSESVADVVRAERWGHDVRMWSRGVDCDRFSPQRRSMDWRRAHGIADDELVISFVGRLVLEKGINVFSRALQALEAKGIKHRALVIGDGPERAKMEKWIPTGVFTGFLHNEELATGYASSDIFFYPSQTETFGNVTLEAMAAGVACVCADATGSRSLVDHGTTGYLAAPEAIDEYAGHLETLAQDDGLRQQMAQAGRDRALGYSWDKVMSDLLSQYREVIANNSHRPPVYALSPDQPAAVAGVKG